VDVDALFTPVADTLALFPGGGDDLAAAAPLTAAERASLFARLRAHHDAFDLVVVDAGSRLEPVLTACDGGVSRLVLVATDDQIALAATHALLKAVTARLGPVAADVIVNRMGGEGAAEIFAPLADAAQRFLDRRLELAGALPHDPCLQGGLGAGMALQDAAAGSPCALAARLIGLRYVNGPESRGASAGDRLLAWHA
jgi:MinD-like ATPase involved in chromosome partitioning or flagellar assembly